LLFLHVGGAIIAFGPTFTFPFLGAMIGREPLHANFGLRFQHWVAQHMILPLALLQGVTGLLLIWRAGFNLFSTYWLLVAIVLYLVALANSFLVLLPTSTRLVEATAAPPPPPPAGAAPPAGPPPHMVALVSRARTAGMLNTVLIVLIVFLMVTKPF
jgi:uncharacterized membrane protein